MKVVLLTLGLVHVLAASFFKKRALCNTDNCLIAVGGIATDPSEIISAQQQCLSYMIATVKEECCSRKTTTLATMATTTNITESISLKQRAQQNDINPRQYRRSYPSPALSSSVTTSSDPPIPSYASPCYNFDQYVSACSCIGIISATVYEECKSSTSMVLSVTLSVSSPNSSLVFPTSSSNSQHCRNSSSYSSSSSTSLSASSSQNNPLLSLKGIQSTSFPLVTSSLLTNFGLPASNPIATLTPLELSSSVSSNSTAIMSPLTSGSSLSMNTVLSQVDSTSEIGNTLNHSSTHHLSPTTPSFSVTLTISSQSNLSSSNKPSGANSTSQSSLINTSSTSSSFKTLVGAAGNQSSSSSDPSSSSASSSISDTNILNSSAIFSMITITNNATSSTSKFILPNSTTTPSTLSSSNSIPTNICIPSIANLTDGQGIDNVTSDTDAGYQPLYAADYAGCAFDPTNPSVPIVLIDASTGRQLLDYFGRLTRSNSSSVNTRNDFGGVFHFSPPPNPTNATCGLYDLVHHSANEPRYIAIFSDAEVGFTLFGSDEQNVDDDVDDFLTTIWSVDCAGVLRAGVVFGAELFFYVLPDGSVLATFVLVTSAFDEKRSITAAKVPAGAVQIPIRALPI